MPYKKQLTYRMLMNVCSMDKFITEKRENEDNELQNKNDRMSTGKTMSSTIEALLNFS